MEPEERRAVAVMQQMRALRKDQIARRKVKQQERKDAHRSKAEKEEEKKEEKLREKRKEHMRSAGIQSKRQAEGTGGQPTKRRRT
jgi:ribosome biogenesis protein BMS1